LKSNLPTKVRKKNENENFFRSRFRFPTIFCFYTPAHDTIPPLFSPFVVNRAQCRNNLGHKSEKYLSTSQNRRTFASSKGQLINSINIKNFKIMKQQNEMSARALTMEELENVNGGMLKKIGGIVGRGKFGLKLWV
jgi:hypothetical protein